MNSRTWVARSRLHLDGEHVADDGLVLTRLIADALGELERLGLLGLRAEEVVEETVERDADEAEVREGHEPVDRPLGVLARVLAQAHDHAGVEGGRELGVQLEGPPGLLTGAPVGARRREPRRAP